MVINPPAPPRSNKPIPALQLAPSQPWGHRLASLLTVLAADSLDTFGRVIYGQMILSGVTGMPDTPQGKPAHDLIQAVELRGPGALPGGYGKPFASRVFKILLSRFSDPEIAEEAMSGVLLQAARHKLQIHNGSDLRGAEAYVITIALNQARDIVRARARRREDSLVRERDDQQTVDLEDPAAFHDLDTLLPPSELRSILQQLGRVHPRAPEWLRARLDGDSGIEIAQEWGTTPSYISKWQRTYVPEIKRLVEHHLRQGRIRVRYSYDFRDGLMSYDFHPLEPLGVRVARLQKRLQESCRA